MPSPFPGMDPFVESQIWEDFHNSVIFTIREQLVPFLRPKYAAQAEMRVYIEHGSDDQPRIVVPDVGVVLEDRTRATRLVSAGVATIEPVVVELPIPEEQREAFLTIRHRETKELVTIIEVLSAANKRPGSDGRAEYLRKRQEYLLAPVNLVELDLLRGGRRLPTSTPLPAGDYFALVRRRLHPFQADAYGWPLAEQMPTIPIPLLPEDPDAHLNLNAAFASVYERAGYDTLLDYARPVDPPLSDAEQKWVASLLTARDRHS